jgi:hypothetical protein
MPTYTNTVVTAEDVFKNVIFVRYTDHVMFSRTDPLMMSPQVREAVGWLVCENQHYVTIKYDKDAELPTLKGGDVKASGLVLLRSDILEMKKLEDLGGALNSSNIMQDVEYALSYREAKNSENKNQA